MPKQREDGRCVSCQKVRHRPKALNSPTALAEWERDPFCSTDCAKRYFGTQVAKDGCGQAGAQRELAYLDADLESARS
jgi:hypothetical protein